MAKIYDFVKILAKKKLVLCTIFWSALLPVASSAADEYSNVNFNNRTGPGPISRIPC